MRACLLAGSVVLLAACGASDRPAGDADAGRRPRDAAARPDAPRRPDAAPAPDAAAPPDAPPPPADGPAAPPDAPADAAPPADAPASTLPTACEGACRTQTLEARFGSAVLSIERSVFGLAPAALHIEALHGGFSGCPEMTSPTPDRTLVLSGLALPLDGTPRTEADGVRATLLDYQGTLLPAAPLTRATAVRVTPIAADLPDGFVALELAATFPEGTVGGHLFAARCPSLDGP